MNNNNGISQSVATILREIAKIVECGGEVTSEEVEQEELNSEDMFLSDEKILELVFDGDDAEDDLARFKQGLSKLFNKELGDKINSRVLFKLLNKTIEGVEEAIEEDEKFEEELQGGPTSEEAEHLAKMAGLRKKLDEVQELHKEIRNELGYDSFSTDGFSITEKEWNENVGKLADEVTQRINNTPVTEEDEKRFHRAAVDTTKELIRGMVPDEAPDWYENISADELAKYLPENKEWIKPDLLPRDGREVTLSAWDKEQGWTKLEKRYTWDIDKGWVEPERTVIDLPLEPQSEPENITTMEEAVSVTEDAYKVFDDIQKQPEPDDSEKVLESFLSNDTMVDLLEYFSGSEFHEYLVTANVSYSMTGPTFELSNDSKGLMIINAQGSNVVRADFYENDGLNNRYGNYDTLTNSRMFTTVSGVMTFIRKCFGPFAKPISTPQFNEAINALEEKAKERMEKLQLPVRPGFSSNGTIVGDEELKSIYGDSNNPFRA